jgi:DNA-binding GntR family transcriptional regulator
MQTAHHSPAADPVEPEERPLPSLARPSISDEIYHVLKDRIIRNHFKPGERLNLDEIERQMGISRTPLVHALTRLSAEGLTEVVPRQGTFVTDPTPEEIAEAFDVRRVLEVYALELAVPRLTADVEERIRGMVNELGRLYREEDWIAIYHDYVSLDEELHRTIVRTSGNRRLCMVWEQVNVHVQMARFRRMKLATVLAVGHAEHEQMVQAFQQRDVPALQRIMAEHIDNAKRLMLEDLAQRAHPEG